MTGAVVRDLTVGVGASGSVIVDTVSLTIAPGEIVGLAGETGSGKSTVGLAMLGLAGPGLSFRAGSVHVGDTITARSPVPLSERSLRPVRGKVVSYVPQDPATALHPGLGVGASFAEVMRAHGVRDPDRQARRRAELFEAVGLPVDEEFAARHPHELSGGQQQRVAIAIAFALDPAVVVMDEPTTGLDVTTRDRVALLVRSLARDREAGILFISHDLSLLVSLADRIAVMHEGAIVEVLPSEHLAARARHPYTRRLLDALPLTDMSAVAAPIRRSPDGPLLIVSGLEVRHGSTSVTHGIDLDLDAGECLAILGESGSGKTSAARAIAGLHPHYSGTVSFGGRRLAADVSARSREERRALQYVFQSPWGSLNPRRSIGATIALAAQQLLGVSRTAAREQAIAALQSVGLRADHAGVLPQRLSGGQRQRAALARALVGEPRVLICDEVTSSLDVSVQAEIVGLLRGLRDERGLAMVFITHDLALAAEVAERTVVLLRGEVVESGDTASVLERPRHPYTASLTEAAYRGREALRREA